MTENSETIVLNKIPKIIDDDKNTKLHYLAAMGKEEELLKDLENEPKVDIENYLGWTPLMMACRNGHIKIVEILLKHRADASKKNRFGMSVFLASIVSGDLKIVDLILQHLLCGGVSKQSMQKLVSPLAIAILFSHEDILEYLIQQNFNLDGATPETGITPLMFASAMDNDEAYIFLLNKGANTTIKNYIGLTAEGIIQFRNKKLEGDRNESEFFNNSPSIVITNPHIQPSHSHLSPYIVISPQPSFIQIPPNQVFTQHIRKSSNTLSPGVFFATPNVTPISPLNLVQPSQVFFPPEFSPHEVYGNTQFTPNFFNFSNDFLNARINASNNSYISPVPQNMSYPSHCA